MWHFIALPWLKLLWSWCNYSSFDESSKFIRPGQLSFLNLFSAYESDFQTSWKFYPYIPVLSQLQFYNIRSSLGQKLLWKIWKKKYLSFGSSHVIKYHVSLAFSILLFVENVFLKKNYWYLTKMFLEITQQFQPIFYVRL